MGAGKSEALNEAVQLVWNYHQLRQTLKPADLIWVLGSHDLRVADRAAELWRGGMAPRVLMSGGFGNLTEGVFHEPEAVLLAKRAEEGGVPPEALLIEDQSTNTGENVVFSRRLLEAQGIPVRSVIAVQKPYMERRTWATIRKQWPEVDLQVTSPQLTFEDYCTEEIDRDLVINLIVGDLDRLAKYPALGFMVEQVIPEEVEQAFEVLVASGYDEGLLS